MPSFLLSCAAASIALTACTFAAPGAYASPLTIEAPASTSTAARAFSATLASGASVSFHQNREGTSLLAEPHSAEPASYGHAEGDAMGDSRVAAWSAAPGAGLLERDSWTKYTELPRRDGFQGWQSSTWPDKEWCKGGTPAIPEPSTCLLMALGLAGMTVTRSRRATSATAGAPPSLP